MHCRQDAKTGFSAGALALPRETLLKAIGAAILLAFRRPERTGRSRRQRNKAPNADQLLAAIPMPPASGIEPAAGPRATAAASVATRRADAGPAPAAEFLADGRTLLVANYESGCRRPTPPISAAPADLRTGKDGAAVFRGYQPGYQANGCVSLARNGEAGPPDLPSPAISGEAISRSRRRRNGRRHAGFLPVTSMLVAGLLRQGGGRDRRLWRQRRSTARKRRFISGLAKLGPGAGARCGRPSISPTPTRTRSGTACTEGFPRPKQTFGELGPGEAYVRLARSHEKKARFP